MKKSNFITFLLLIILVVLSCDDGNNNITSSSNKEELIKETNLEDSVLYSKLYRYSPYQQVSSLLEEQMKYDYKYRMARYDILLQAINKFEERLKTLESQTSVVDTIVITPDYSEILVKIDSIGQLIDNIPTTDLSSVNSRIDSIVNVLNNQPEYVQPQTFQDSINQLKLINELQGIALQDLFTFKTYIDQRDRVKDSILMNRQEGMQDQLNIINQILNQN